MRQLSQSILEGLEVVERERQRRGADAAFAARVLAVKGYQHLRFERTYADVLADTRYGSAARFFLDDLYGPTDFSERDRQFARIVPALVRLFPAEIVATVDDLVQLHALSERLDSLMAHCVPRDSLEVRDYAVAWRQVGEPDSRERQIQLMVSVGSQLDRFTRRALLRHSLRLMRAPAQAAGLGALQSFLERGFDTFRAMNGARDFLRLVASRERAFTASLFSGNDQY